MKTAFARVPVGGESIHACTEQEVVAAVRAALDRGAGGRIITPNVDILRRARRDPAVRAYLADASFVVADGMPLVWASRLAGTPLPERVCGSSLIWSLAQGLGRDGRSVYVLGGEPAMPVRQREPGDGPARPGAAGDGPARPGAAGDGPAPQRRAGAVPGNEALRAAYAAGVADAARALGSAPPARSGGPADAEPQGRRDGAWRAAERLAAASPGLRIAGWHSPAYGFDRDPASLAAVCRRVVETKPDLVYVGVGFPRQEEVITRLRADLPFTWFLGCGAAVNFVAGDQPRAPLWMQRSGLEWAHRLAREPRRLAGRYVWHDAPYAVRLLAGACATRYRARGRV